MIYIKAKHTLQIGKYSILITVSHHWNGFLIQKENSLKLFRFLKKEKFETVK